MAAIDWSQLLAYTIRFSLQGNRLTSTLHYFIEGTVDPDIDAGSLVTDWTANVEPALQAVLSDQCVLDGYYVRPVKPAEFRTFDQPGNNLTGAGTGQALPSNLALVLAIQQEEVSSKANNRIFLPGVEELNQDDGIVNGTWVASGPMHDLLVALITPLTLTGGRNAWLACVQKNLGGTPIEPIGYKATGVACQATVFNQRRRIVERNAFAP